MSISQVAGVVVAVALVGIAAWNAIMSRSPRSDASIDACAADALALAARLRAAGCPEGVAACQTLLNVILEHPGHAKPEVPA